MFGRKKRQAPQQQLKSKTAPPASGASRVKASLLSLEQRLMFDAAAAATAAEVNQEQVAQEQAEAAVSSEGSSGEPTAAETESQDLLQAIASYNPGESSTEVVFVDPSVPNYGELLSGMDPNIEVIMLDGGQDGVEQIAAALSGRSGIDAVHLISHGDAGTLQLGTGMLNVESMSGQYADEMATIQQALSEQADILVYGCDFAEGDVGQAAVTLLADLTGADVQASNDETGHISLGGDWEFEVSTGTIETSQIVGYEAQMNWAGILGTETVSDTFSAASYSNNNGTQSWSTSWSETDAGGGGASGGDVRVNSSQLRIDTDTVGNAISRGVDLSNATSATLTFNYTNSLTGSDRIELRVSTDGGANYQTVSGGVFSNSANTGSGNASVDLSSYMSANTRIQFVVTATGGGERLYVDNVQISYETPTNSAPTISNLSGDRLSYTEGAGAIVIDQGANALVVDSDSANFDTGTLTVSIPSGAEPGEDVIGIRNQGTGAGQIGVNGSNVTYGGVTIGTYTGGAGGNNLVITFNENATPASVTALARNITYEDINTDSPAEGGFAIRFVLRDGDGGTSANYDVSAWVSGVNDAPTDLALSANTVAENAANGTVVGTVSGTDPDSGDTKSYSLTDSAGGRFAINSSTGVITVANGSLLDYEAATSHNITVRITDSGGLTYSETFTINLTNVNEFAPTITSNGGGATASVSVAENNTTVTTIAATDSDAEQTLSYSITGGADAAQFTINSSTGALSFVSAPNYEAPADSSGNNVYDVTVQVSDGNGGTDTQNIAVTVTNANENPTDLALSANTVAENAANGTVVGIVSGTDPDSSDTKTYSLADTAGGRFAINSSTGQITVANSSLLNYESATNHSVTVRVTDSGGLTYDETFTINLTNVNETPTDLSLSANTVAENASNGTVIGTVSGTDPDSGDTKSYSFTDSAGGRFAINSSTGQITVANSSLLNYESATSHSVTVRVTDSGGLTYDETFSINLTNVNETPTDLSLSANTVAENAANGTVVGTVSGTDPDASDTKNYSFTDSAGGRFAINSSTGQITVADGSLLNYESASSHSVTVRVTDSGGLTYDETFTINLTDVNEAPTGADATVTINEDTAHTLTTANFGFSDVDAGDSFSAVRIDSLPSAGTLTLSGVAVTAGQVVSLANITAGNLVFTPAANATGSGYASLTFSVRDGSSAYDTAPNTLTVDVTAVNDAPTDLALSANTVTENAANGTVVGTVMGTDVDTGDTKSYSFTDSAGGRFAINSSTGEITVANSSLLNYEQATSHTVTVRVTDSGGLMYDETFTINVTNVNETPTGADTTVTIAEDVPHVFTTENFGFSDVDAGDSLSAVRIDMLPTAGTLTLSGAAVTAGQVVSVADLTAGNLVFTQAADATGTGYASLTFSVRDSNNAYDAAPNTLTVDVTAVNDAPVVTVDPSDVNFTEQSPVGIDVNLTISDVDSGTMTGATVRISANYESGADELAFTDQNGITGTWNSTNGTLTLSGTASVADYQTALRSITFYNGSDTPSPLTRTVEWIVTDGADPSAAVYRDITVTVQNDASVVTAVGPTVTFVEGGSPQVIGPLMTVTDTDSTNFDTGVLTVSLTQNGTVDDRLQVGNFGTGPGQVGTSGSNVTYEGVVIGIFTGGTSASDPLVITFNANATVAAVQEVVTSIQFQNVSESPSTATRQVTFELTDGDGGTATPATKLVNVQATNDAPTDLALSANTVAENAVTGTVVGTVSGTDSDSGDTKTYSLTDTAGGRFAIDSATGQITVADGSLLNYEGATNHAVTVRVTDSGGLTYDETFTIHLTNVNETPTDLSLSANSVAENASTGTVVGTVSGTDPDAGDTKTYSLTDTAGGRFAIDASTGVITVADGSLLNYEAATSHTLTVQVTDSGGQRYTESFTINLTNVNEGPTGADVAVTLSEDTSHTLTTTNFGFSDVDAGDSLSAVRIDTLPTAGTLILSGVAVTAGQVVTAADITAGRLIFSPAADANGTGYASLTFSVQDSHSTSDTAPNTLTFNVTAVNDTPTDLSLSANGVAENAATGTVVGTVTSSDPDSRDTKTYSLTDTAGGRFAIDPTTGQITVANSSLLDYESATSHSVTVRVTDSGGLTYDETFTINLTNVNETPTGADATVTITEDTAHTFTMSNFGFSDVDAGDSLSAVRIDTLPSAGTLTLSGVAVTAGQVVTAADIAAGLFVFTPAPNATGTGYASLTFSVRDSNNAYDTNPNTLTVDVTAVNDAPILNTNEGATVDEGASIILSAKNLDVVDVDNGASQVLYTITSLPINGTILLKGMPLSVKDTFTQDDIDSGIVEYQHDGSETDSDSFAFVVDDGAGGSLEESTFKIAVTPVNDAPTDLSLSSNTVAENAANGTVVGIVSGTDPDSSDTKTYSLADTAGGRFAINSSTGQITVANSSLLNYESATSHSVTVRVTDSGGLTYDETFTINLTNVNETPTDLSLSANTVAENASNGTVIGTVSGTDPDSGDTKTYSFTDSAGGRFAINSSTGQITVADGSLLNYESATNHTVTVRVTDSGGLTYDETFSINLTNVNETPTDLNLSANTVAENAANGTVIGTVSGTDPDSGDTKTYSFTDSAGGRFAINSSTGQITVANSSLLNYESATSHSVTVRVTDSGGQTYDETFTITLTNVNEAPTGGDATVTISEDTSHTLTTMNFGFSDVDAGDSLSAVRIDTVPSAGTLTLSGVNVTAGQVITVADLTAGHLVFTPAADANGTGYTSFTFSVRDIGGTYDSAPNTLTVDVTAVNDAPVVTPVAPDVTFVEGGMPQVIDATGTITDVDSTNFDTGVMTISITQNGSSDDRLVVGNFGTGPGQAGTTGNTVTYEGVAVGSFTGGSSGSDPLVITFNTSATPAAVQEIYRSIQFNNVSESPSTSTRQVTFSLADGDGGTATPQAKLVYVQASNDAPTDLTLSANIVAENAANGTVIGTVSGTDPDSGDTKTYTFTDSGGGRFAINSSTGVITVADGSLLNYEGATNHSVTVRVTDSGGLTYDETFTINLTDVNEAPTDLSLSANTVAENATNGTVVGTASTTDQDTGDTHTYQLTDSAGGRFAINSATGVITVADGTLLDYETATSHTITVRTTDAGGLTYDRTFTINLTNVNEAPTLSTNTGSTVAEEGTDTITASELAVTDVDNSAAQLTYSIGTGPANGRLELTTAPGLSATTFTQADIAANRLIYVHDGSETTSDSFTFTVSDGAGGSLGATTVTLTITPVNDAPTITSNGGGSAAAINVAENVSAVTIVTGADPDLPSQALTYSLSGGADQALFTIDASTGALSFTAPPDFEAATDANGDHVYVVQVQVLDSQGASTTQTIQVTVTDVAETVASPSTVLTIPPVLLTTAPLESEKRGQPVATERNESPASLSTPTADQPSKAAETTSHSNGEVRPSATSAEPPVFIKQEDTRRYETAKLEPVMPRWDDSLPASPFTILPVEPEQPIAPKPSEEQASLSDILIAKLDAMTESLEDAIGVEEEQEKIVARVAALSGTTLSVGFVAWAVRSSALLASCLTTLPAWKSFDPLPVVRLTKHERDRRRQETDAIQRQEQKEFGGLEKFF